LVGALALLYGVIVIVKLIIVWLFSVVFGEAYDLGGLPAVVILLVVGVAGYIGWDLWSKQKKKGT
jgi:hypothetical protein